MIQDSTLKLIEGFEGKSYTAYNDVAGKPTNGIGHLIKPYEQHYLTETLTDEQVYALLRADLAWVEKCIDTHVTVELNQNQFNALASFVFNLGCTNFNSSTLLKLINASYEEDDIRASWMKWCHSNGEVVEGLKTRRKAEADLFFS